MKWTIFAALAAMVGTMLFGQEPGAIPAPPASGEQRITILHTNDLHGFLMPWRGWDGEMAGKRIGGAATLAGAIRQIRAQVGAENVLLLDGGDAVGDTMLGDASRGVAVIEVLRTLGYRAMTLGSQDFAHQIQSLQGSPTIRGMDLLAANVVDVRTDRPVLRPYIVQRVGGVRVGILGLAYASTPYVTPQRDIAEARFLADTSAVVRQYLPEMQARSDLIVVLSHLGLAADEQLAEAVEGIDLIVGGQSHNRIATPRRVGRTLIVQAGAMGSDLGRLDLVVRNGQVVAVRRELILLDNDRFPADPEVQGIVDRYLARIAPQARELLATTRVPIPRTNVFALDRPLPRGDQSPADALFADAIRQQTNADVAILPGRDYGVAMGPGDITAQDLRRLVPQDARVVSYALSGEQLRQVLDRSIQNAYSGDPLEQVGGVAQVSGMTFRYDPGRTQGSAVTEAMVGGRPLDPKRTYVVAVDSLMADGGARYDMFHDLKAARDWGSEYAMVRDWMLLRRTVAPPEDVRIARVTTPGRVVPAAGRVPAGAR